jgi:Protein of unknown function (DUF1569)
MPVDTAKVEGRRKVNYTSLQELLTDAERLSAGPVKTLGNWSPGQIYRHLAISFNGSIDGFTMNFPWYLRLMARLLKKKLISGAMPPGYKLPPEAAKAVMPGPTSTEDGLSDLRAAIARLERETHRAEHPMFGSISNEEWNRIYLNHANLHMSFLVPQ